MKLTKGKVLLVAGAATAVVSVAGPAIARHSWNNYHWLLSPGQEITVPVIDQTDASWRGHTQMAVNDWNQSTVIQAPYVNGTAGAECTFVENQIQVCNDDYGSVGWVGLASITLANGHINSGWSKMNDYYFNQPQYSSNAWRQAVMCQEIGHDYGLGHQNENFRTDSTTSCMEYTSNPEGNESPDAHDYEQLLDIYAHDDASGGGGGGNGGGRGRPNRFGAQGNGNAYGIGNRPETWGQPIGFLPDGRPNVYEKHVEGVTVVTHVTWAIGEGPRGNHHRGGGDHHH
ncbi:hypothetical protein [Aurantiacibacter sp. MUD61]|uniref:hypothetical protein n=1 Tax=Aurantiacibacter sp. MUD61 TaxID=3009083 RepID=UPI0022F12A76|nr:hypothetical protein [Aurantiacibacter sp. MUD61]